MKGKVCGTGCESHSRRVTRKGGGSRVPGESNPMERRHRKSGCGGEGFRKTIGIRGI